MKLVSTGEPASNAMSEFNPAMLVHFLEAIVANGFHAHFKISRLNVKRFLNQIMSLNTIPAKKIEEVMKGKA